MFALWDWNHSLLQVENEDLTAQTKNAKHRRLCVCVCVCVCVVCVCICVYACVRCVWCVVCVHMCVHVGPIVHPHDVQVTFNPSDARGVSLMLCEYLSD